MKHNKKNITKKNRKNRKNKIKNLKITKRNNKKRNQRMRGGSISDFIKNKNNGSEEIIELGRGGAGIVYLDKSQPNLVFKVSKSNDTCRIWGKEAKIYNTLNSFNIDTNLCKILKMTDFIQDDEYCCLELHRAFNPLGNDVYYTIHPHFQYKELDYATKGRGRFLGIQNLKNLGIFNDDNIIDYIIDLSILLARLHYKVKNDGYDLELFLSKENDKIIIYIADFDLSEFYTIINNTIIERLAWSLEAVPYFPIEGELYEIFSKNYINEAEKYDMKHIAEEVLKIYSS
jgi:hypothetical protein